MSNPGWHFKRRERSDEVADPIQGEFFDEAAREAATTLGPGLPDQEAGIVVI